MEHERERKVRAVLRHIATGDMTYDSLRQAVVDGQAEVERLGPHVEPATVEALAAGKEALTWIERAQSELGLNQ